MRHESRIVEATAAAPQPPHAEFLGLPFCLLPQQQVVRLIIDHCGAPYRYVVTPNSYDLVTAHEEPDRSMQIYRGAWLSLCDSQILRALARLQGYALPLVTGSDLVAALFSLLNTPNSEREPLRLLVVGPPLATRTALRVAYPNLSLDVLPAPAGLAGDAELRLAVARACVEQSWDILLLCVGCPAQGLIARQIAELGRIGGVALCVGGAVDFLIGVRVRAPRWVQKLSLEWAFRLAQEPGRLWYRYLVKSPNVLRIFVATLLPGRRWRQINDESQTRPIA
jgi:exopolysaccharide biosynthesis WecB/TagA/CpsF family protein